MGERGADDGGWDRGEMVAGGLWGLQVKMGGGDGRGGGR